MTSSYFVYLVYFPDVVGQHSLKPSFTKKTVDNLNPRDKTKPEEKTKQATHLRDEVKQSHLERPLVLKYGWLLK